MFGLWDFGLKVLSLCFRVRVMVYGRIRVRINVRIRVTLRF